MGDAHAGAAEKSRRSSGRHRSQSNRPPVTKPEVLSMIPEIGHFALILPRLVVAAILGTLPLVGAHRNRLAWVALARPAAMVSPSSSPFPSPA